MRHGDSARVRLPRRRAARWLLLYSAAIGGLGPAGIGCGGEGPADAVVPLTAVTSTTVSGAGASTTTYALPVAEPEPAESAVGSGTSAIRSEIEALLGRFDRAISDLSADPEAAGDDVHPLTIAWLEVVTAGSALDEEVRSRILTQGLEDNMRYVADADGTTYRHRALDITTNTDGTLALEYCGYSPGTGIDRDTGAVLDDRRSTIRGHAVAVRGPLGTLMMLRFTDDSVEQLAPGAADPCPALSEEARLRETSARPGGPE